MKKENSFDLKKIVLTIIFIVYLVFLFRVLFYRRLSNVGGLDVYQRICSTTNLVPFNFFYDFQVVEVIGNFLLLMPLAIFLPSFFSKMKKVYFYFSIIIIAFAIEAIQLVTATGIFDINDIILNATGAILVFKVIYYYKSKYKVI